MNDFATVGGICVGVTGSGRAAFCYHCAFGQQQLSPTAEKQHTLARWQFVAGWRLVCDLLVCLMCLSTVGPCWMLATVPIMLRWRVCFNWTRRRFWNIPSLSIWGNQFASCGEIFMDSSMKPSPSVCQFGNIKQDFAEENTKPGSLAAVRKGTRLGSSHTGHKLWMKFGRCGSIKAGASTPSKHCKGTLEQGTKAPNVGVLLVLLKCSWDRLQHLWYYRG